MTLRALDPGFSHRAAVAEDAAAGAIADLVDIVEQLLTREGGSRPMARRDLERVAELAHIASRAISDTDAPWPGIRFRAIVSLAIDRPLPRLFQIVRQPEGNTHHA